MSLEQAARDALQVLFFGACPEFPNQNWDAVKAAVRKASRILQDGIEALAQQEKPEPVAWLVEGLHEGKLYARRCYLEIGEAKSAAAKFAEHYSTVTTSPLYTQPPRREWVGLTEDQRDELMSCTADSAFMSMEDMAAYLKGSRDTESKLKELNT